MDTYGEGPVVIKDLPKEQIAQMISNILGGAKFVIFVFEPKGKNSAEINVYGSMPLEYAAYPIAEMLIKITEDDLEIERIRPDNKPGH